MFPLLTEQEAPVRLFETLQAAREVAEKISNTPRKGEARVQFVGYHNAYIVEVVPRSDRYCNPAVLRINGVAAKYH